MKIGDKVTGVGVGEVKSVSNGLVTVKMVEHPDPAIVGMTYTNKECHFRVLETEAKEQPKGFFSKLFGRK